MWSKLHCHHLLYKQIKLRDSADSFLVYKVQYLVDWNHLQYPKANDDKKKDYDSYYYDYIL